MTATPDIFATYRTSLLEAFNAATAKFDELSKTTLAEIEKGNAKAEENFAKGLDLYRANIDALVASSTATVEGLKKVGELTKDHATALAEARVALVKETLATEPKAADTVVEKAVTEAKAEYEKNKAFAEQAGSLLREAAEASVAPLKARAEANLEVLTSAVK